MERLQNWTQNQHLCYNHLFLIPRHVFQNYLQVSLEEQSWEVRNEVAALQGRCRGPCGIAQYGRWWLQVAAWAPVISEFALCGDCVDLRRSSGRHSRNKKTGGAKSMAKRGRSDQIFLGLEALLVSRVQRDLHHMVLGGNKGSQSIFFFSHCYYWIAMARFYFKVEFLGTGAAQGLQRKSNKTRWMSCVCNDFFSSNKLFQAGIKARKLEEVLWCLVRA